MIGFIVAVMSVVATLGTLAVIGVQEVPGKLMGAVISLVSVGLLTIIALQR